MDLVVSPYEISARSIGAMAAPVLAWPSGSALTLRPEPLEGGSRPAVTRVSSGVAGMSRFLESWRWTAGLWREGLLRARKDGAEPLEAVRALCARIQSDPALATLRAVVRPELFEDSEMYLGALLRDLDRGGGDPEVTLPVQSGLEALAASLGVPIVRTHRASARPAAAAAPLFAFTLPLLAEADGESILEMVHTLEPELTALDAALTAVARAVLRTGAPAAPANSDALASACVAYADAFARASPTLRAHAEAAGDPFRACEAAVIGELTEPGASLAAAARGFGRLAQTAPVVRTGAGSPGLVRAESGPLLVLSVRRLPFAAPTA